MNTLYIYTITLWSLLLKENDLIKILTCRTCLHSFLLGCQTPPGHKHHTAASCAGPTWCQSLAASHHCREVCVTNHIQGHPGTWLSNEESKTSYSIKWKSSSEMYMTFNHCNPHLHKPITEMGRAGADLRRITCVSHQCKITWWNGPQWHSCTE